MEYPAHLRVAWPPGTGAAQRDVSHVKYGCGHGAYRFTSSSNACPARTPRTAHRRVYHTRRRSRTGRAGWLSARVLARGTSTIRRAGLPSRRIVGTGLAPVLAGLVGVCSDGGWDVV